MYKAVAEALRDLTDNRFSQASGSPPKFEYIQTYLLEEESRDGLELVGSYGYLDPTGALVIVRYDWRSKQTDESF